MKQKVLVVVFTVLLFIISTTRSNAIDMAKGYTLPYPSVMPGSISYKLHLLLIKIEQLWSFGSLTQFEFNLHESDEFLVQAKTLFEYDQYLLAYNALLQSNIYFAKAKQDLEDAKNEGKDVSQVSDLFKSASVKHQEVLYYIRSITPWVFVWSPEKAASSTLSIHDEIQHAISIRKTL